jgi:sporulation protein YlmC with PRC-barrel domain
MNLELRSAVRCVDGAVCELADVVVDAPVKRVTHLVVEPKHDHEVARLVSLDLAREDADGVVICCTADTLHQLEPVREFAYLPPGVQPEEGGEWGIGIEDVVVVPTLEPVDLGAPEPDPNVNLIYDRVPRGEVELRLTSSVYSADKHRLGSVRGVVVDDEGGMVVLTLLRGHFWWKREIAVPAGAISSLENDLVTLAVAKRELKRFSSRRPRGRSR